jgi:hypothetical protein
MVEMNFTGDGDGNSQENPDRSRAGPWGLTDLLASDLDLLRAS